jgi:hypothetical protein
VLPKYRPNNRKGVTTILYLPEKSAAEFLPDLEKGTEFIWSWFSHKKPGFTTRKVCLYIDLLKFSLPLWRGNLWKTIEHVVWSRIVSPSPKFFGIIWQKIFNRIRQHCPVNIVVAATKSVSWKRPLTLRKKVCIEPQGHFFNSSVRYGNVDDEKYFLCYFYIVAGERYFPPKFFFFSLLATLCCIK